MTPHEKMIEKGKELVQVQRDIARLEDEIKAAKKREAEIADHEMPELMDEAEVKEFVTPAGRKVSIKEKIVVQLKEANRPAMFEWCRKNGLAGVVKNTIEVVMGQGREANDNTDALAELAEAAGVELHRKSKIEPSTLRRLARERHEAGEMWPEDIAPMTILRTVEIKEPKK